MKATSFFSIIMLITLSLVGCAPNNPPQQLLPVALSGQVIQFQYLSTSGIFKNLQWHTREISFKDSDLYQAKLRSGLIRAYGIYLYQLLQAD